MMGEISYESENDSPSPGPGAKWFKSSASVISFVVGCAMVLTSIWSVTEYFAGRDYRISRIEDVVLQRTDEISKLNVKMDATQSKLTEITITLNRLQDKIDNALNPRRAMPDEQHR